MKRFRNIFFRIQYRVARTTKRVKTNESATDDTRGLFPLTYKRRESYTGTVRIVRNDFVPCLLRGSPRRIYKLYTHCVYEIRCRRRVYLPNVPPPSVLYIACYGPASAPAAAAVIISHSRRSFSVRAENGVFLTWGDARSE